MAKWDEIHFEWMCCADRSISGYHFCSIILLTQCTKVKFSKAELIKMCSIATSHSHFLFNGRVFHQIDGAAMGSHLTPSLANLFLGHHENMWLKSYQSPSVPFYR